MASLEDIVKWNRDIAQTVNPIDFYKEHYAGMTRGKLKMLDPNLYRKLRRDGLLEHVPTSIRLLGDQLEYYQLHYAGMTRGKLRMLDPSLYQSLRRDGLLEHVPTKFNKA